MANVAIAWSESRTGSRSAASAMSPWSTRGPSARRTRHKRWGFRAGHVAKTLVLHEAGSYRLVVIPAPRRLDLSRMPRELLRMDEPQVADMCERIPEPHNARFAELPRP